MTLFETTESKAKEILRAQFAKRKAPKTHKVCWDHACYVQDARERHRVYREMLTEHGLPFKRPLHK